MLSILNEGALLNLNWVMVLVASNQYFTTPCVQLRVQHDGKLYSQHKHLFPLNMCQSTDIEDRFLSHGVPTTDEEFDKSLFQYLCDSHCHPHDDIEHLSHIPQLKTGHITIMGVRQDDWDTVSKVAHDCNQNANKKCIPCFGEYAVSVDVA